MSDFVYAEKNATIEWQPITTAPRDGRQVLCWSPGYEPRFFRWKTNTRIASMRVAEEERRHRGGYITPVAARENEEFLRTHVDCYFGDPWEYDDYDFAIPDNAPTHWMAMPRPPAGEMWRKGLTERQAAEEAAAPKALFKKAPGKVAVEELP